MQQHVAAGRDVLRLRVLDAAPAADGSTPPDWVAMDLFSQAEHDELGRPRPQRADAGAWLARLDNTETRLGGQKLQAQAERSSAEDLDMVQAISDFQNQQTGYQAALQTYATVQRLSLFDFIK